MTMTKTEPTFTSIAFHGPPRPKYYINIRSHLSGLVASGAVYFGQLDRRSRRTPAYVTTGSIRTVRWSGSRDLSACSRTLARWGIELWSISHDLGEDYKRKGRTWERREVICWSVAELLERV